MSSRGNSNDTIMAAVKGTADAVGRLLSAHAKLIRLELREDVTKLGRHVAWLAVVALVSVLGYAVVVIGVAALFAPAYGWAAPLLALGGLHIGIGAIIGWRTLKGLQSFSPLDDTKRTTRVSVNALAHQAQQAARSVAQVAQSGRIGEAGHHHG